MSNLPPLVLRLRLTGYVVLGVVLAIFLTVLAAFGHMIGGVIAGVVAGLYIWFAVRAAKRRITLDDHGITDTGFFTPTTIAWDDVDHYTFLSMGQQYAAAGAGGAAGALAIVLIVLIARAVRKKNPNRTFGMGVLKIVGKQGDKLALMPQLHGVDAALDRAFAELHPRLRAAKTDAELFAPLALTPTGIAFGKKGELALPDIDKVVAGNGQIKIRKRDKRLAWATVGMRRVRNSMLLLEQLAERGIVVSASQEVFVPPPVMAKMLAASGRAAALPSARVVVR